MQLRSIFTVLSCLLLINCSYSQTYSARYNPWRSLFDGKTLNGWKQIAGTAPYEVINGEIVGTAVVGKVNSFLVTDNSYKDFILELEARIEDSTINSGVQFRSAMDYKTGKVYGYQYEVEGSSRRWSGGIYDESRRMWLYPMGLNPSAQTAFNVDGYNKIRIECVGNVVRTWLNGRPASHLIDSATTPGFIALQVHNITKDSLAGKKVRWRNIRIKTTNLVLTPFPNEIFIVNTLFNNVSEQEKKIGWRLLFDGKTSKGWRGAYKQAFPTQGWSIRNGELVVQSSEGKESTNGGDIVTIKKYKAFDLTFDFNLTPGANSGVKYFVTLKENNQGSAIGLEYQVLDDTLHPDAKLGRNGNRTMASLYDLLPAVKQSRFINQPGNWNRGRIVVYPNNHVEHYLNGVKVLEYDRGSTEYRELVKISKYNVWPGFGEAEEGHILLQDHGNEVRFRSVKIRELK